MLVSSMSKGTSSSVTTTEPRPNLRKDAIIRCVVSKPTAPPNPLPPYDIKSAIHSHSVNSGELSALRNIALDDESPVDIATLLTRNPIRKKVICDPEGIVQATEGSPDDNPLLQEEYDYVVALRKARMEARRQLYAKLHELREQRLRHQRLLRKRSQIRHKRSGDFRRNGEKGVVDRLVGPGSKTPPMETMAADVGKDKIYIKAQDCFQNARCNRQQDWYKGLHGRHGDTMLGSSMSGPAEAAPTMVTMETETP